MASQIGRTLVYTIETVSPCTQGFYFMMGKKSVVTAPNTDYSSVRHHKMCINRTAPALENRIHHNLRRVGYSTHKQAPVLFTYLSQTISGRVRPRDLILAMSVTALTKVIP